MHGIQIAELGGPEVLSYVEMDEPDSAPGRLVVDVAAAGVNFIDTYQRNGLYELALPFTPGLEGAGTVVSVGEGVEGFSPGDLVAWADVIGSYAERASLRAERVVVVPDGIDADVAAAAMLQGLTAHYLATSTFSLQPGHRCLVHAGAGGVGRLLVQIAKHVGAEVFSTVGSEEKAALADEAGADHVILYRKVPFVEAVESIAGSRPLDVVYDGVGASTFHDGLALLRPRGTMVTFGNASGPVEPISPLILSRNGSLFLTRPTLGHYIADRRQLEDRTNELFGWIIDGTIDVLIGSRHPLAEAEAAHRALEGRATVGKTLLVT